MKVWSVEIDSGEDSYLAMGLDDRDMPVYRVAPEGLYPTIVRYPVCMKFLTGDASEVELVEDETIRDRYGPVIL